MSATIFQAPGNRALKFIAVAAASALPDPSTLNNGDYYVVSTPGTLWGKTWAADDWAISDGTNYSQKADATKQVAEGGTGATTAAGARTNLGVNSIDEDAEAIGTKLVGPALYFKTNNYVQIADDDKLTLPDDALTIHVVIRPDGTLSADSGVISKDDGTNREWHFVIDENGVSDQLRFILFTDGLNYTTFTALAGSDLLLGSPQYITFTYDGTTGVIYRNGKSQSTTSTPTGSGFSGFANTGAVLNIGKVSTGTFFNGHFYRCVLLNRCLTAVEVVRLARGVDLGFADEGGDHTTEKITDGGMESWASGTALNNFTADAGVAVVQEATDKIAGTYSAKLTLSVGGGIGAAWLSQASVFDVGKGHRVTVAAKIVSGSTDSLQVGSGYTEFARFDGTTWTAINCTILSQTSLGSGWYKVVFEAVASLYSQLTFSINGTTDSYFIDEVSAVSVGIIADLRAENFDESTGKLYDESVNAFVGVNNGAALVGRALPVYKPGTFTPGLTFGGGNTGMTIASSEGCLTRDGNLCHIEGMITLSAKGTSTGAAVITGLEFLGPNLSGNNIPVTFGRCANMDNLTSPIIGNIVDNSNTIALQDVGATGSVDLDETNFTDTTVITFSATYRIQ